MLENTRACRLLDCYEQEMKTGPDDQIVGVVQREDQ